MNIPFPPPHIKTSQRCIIVKDGNDTILNEELRAGWNVKCAVATQTEAIVIIEFVEVTSDDRH